MHKVVHSTKHIQFRKMEKKKSNKGLRFGLYTGTYRKKIVKHIGSVQVQLLRRLGNTEIMKKGN